MVTPLLKPEIQDYIDANIGSDVSKLALLKNPFPDVELPALLNQIAAKNKAKNKLPSWFQKKKIIYPSKVSIEQTSSEVAALYKSEIVSGGTLIDLTGGFGVDTYYFAKRINEVTHCEINADLSAIVAHNFGILNATNIKCLPGDSNHILKNLDQQFDWIYIDPSRRHDDKGKVFMLKDCQPNVPELLDFYFNYSNNILIKTAPVLDISAGFSELKWVKAIYIIAIENEVKELNWELSKNYNGKIKIKTMSFNKDSKQVFDFILNKNSASASYSLPKKYLFEPNSAVMKSGGFNEISCQLNVDKLHLHSHLYTSDELIDFPGRRFEINKIISYSKTDMKTNLENSKANVTTRNFPEPVETIRKRWNIKDGGDQYCFFTSDVNDNKIVLICTKIQHNEI